MKNETAADLRTRAAAARATAAEANDEADRLSAAYLKAERAEQQAKTAAENAAHYNRMYDEIGQPAGLNAGQHHIVYAMAWEHGHASGYSEVESYYGDFAEMARKLIDGQ